MIIGLHKVSVDDAKELANTIPGKTRIYEPANFEDYTKTIKAYNPKDKKNHLILLKTHVDYADSLTSAQWRIYEYFFDLIGGTIWGDVFVAPGTSMTYQGHVGDHEAITAAGQWGASRSVLVRGKTRKYLGRASTNPHTILVGYSIEFAASSKPFNYLVSSLPTTSDWWQGVGFIRAVPTIPTKFFEHFDDPYYVAIGEKPHVFLDNLGIEHGRVPELTLKQYRDTEKNDKVGVALRNAAAEGRNTDRWTF